MGQTIHITLEYEGVKCDVDYLEEEKIYVGSFFAEKSYTVEGQTVEEVETSFCDKINEMQGFI